MKFVLTLDITPNYYEDGENIEDYFVGIVEEESYEVAYQKVQNKLENFGVNSLIGFETYTELYGFKLQEVQKVEIINLD